MFLRRVAAYGLVLTGWIGNVSAQDQSATAATTITVQSQLVLVPTEVRTKKGDNIYGLHAGDFAIEADGVPQRVQLDESGDPVPLSLVVLVQCSRTAFREGPKIRGLGTMVDAIVGGAPGSNRAMTMAAPASSTRLPMADG